jgi:hypothetical protein
MDAKYSLDMRAFLICGLLVLIVGCYTGSIVYGSLTSSMVEEGSKVVVDWTEDDMYRYSTYTVMYWKGFLKSKVHEDYWLNSYEEIQDIDLHLEFDFDKMLVTGYFSGGSESATSYYESKQVFNGEISGTINRLNSYGKWYWEWEGTATITLQYILKQPYSDATGQHLNIRDETIQVTGDFWGDNIGSTTVDVLWKDNGGHEQDERKFSFSFDEEEGLVPPEWPTPIDINLEVTGPEYISIDQKEATFEIEVSGSEVSSIQQVVWHFWYGDEEYYWHINSEEKPEPTSLTVTSTFMEEWVQDFEKYSETVNGTEQLQMMVEVILFADTNQQEQLVAPVEYEFTFIDADVDTTTGEIVPPGETVTSETPGESQSPDSSTGGTSIPIAGDNPLISPIGIAAAGGALTLTGYGVYRALKKPSFRPSKGSELKNELRELDLSSKEGQLNIEDAEMSGTIDSGQLDVSTGKSITGTLELQEGSKIQPSIDKLATPFEQSIPDEPAKPDSTLIIEGAGTPNDTPDSGVKPSFNLKKGSELKNEPYDIDLGSEEGQLTIKNAEMSGTIDSGQLDVSTGKSNTSALKIQEGSLFKSSIHELATPVDQTISGEPAIQDSTLRIEGVETPNDTADSGVKPLIDDTKLNGQFKLNMGIEGDGNFSANSHTITDAGAPKPEPKIDENLVKKLKSSVEEETKNTDTEE